MSFFVVGLHIVQQFKFSRAVINLNTTKFDY